MHLSPLLRQRKKTVAYYDDEDDNLTVKSYRIGTIALYLIRPPSIIKLIFTKTMI